jgi:hypothetical protein
MSWRQVTDGKEKNGGALILALRVRLLAVRIVAERGSYRAITEEGAMADNGQHRMSSLAERARSALTNAEQDDHLRQAAALTKEAAARAQEASKHVSRLVGQQDAWDELRNDVELLTELTRTHHAMIVDLIDRVAALEERSGAS